MSDLLKVPNQNMNRRSFLMNVLTITGSVLGLVVAIPVVGSLLEPLFRKVPQTWRSVGKVNDFKINETVMVTFTNAAPDPWAGVTAQTASWLRRESADKFTAFAVNCTHLGCPVRWEAEAELFLCPCHGGVYNKDGSVAAGPPPNSLNTYPVRIKNDQVEIQASPIPITTD